ncbi:MAG: hypothetical protein Q9221_008876 [Calogaya cf. arnoldii]
MAPTCPSIDQWLKSLIVLLFVVDTVTAACYLPNGMDRNAGFPSDTYFPINPGDGFSIHEQFPRPRPSDGQRRADHALLGWQLLLRRRHIGLILLRRGSRRVLERRDHSGSQSILNVVFAIANTINFPNVFRRVSRFYDERSVIRHICVFGTKFAGQCWRNSRRRRVKKTAENAVGLPEGYPPTSQAWSWPYKNNTRTEPQEAQGSYAEDYKKSELKAAPVSWTAGRSELDGGQRSELGGGQRSELDGGQTNPPAKFPK